MPIAVQTALISAGVAVLTAALGAFFTWNQIRQERLRIQLEGQKIEQERLRIQLEGQQIEQERLQIQLEGQRIQEEIKQIQHERQKWLIEIKKMYAEEHFKARLKPYAQVWKLFAQISTRAKEEPTPERAKEIAENLNDWFYDVGGMCAEESTRGALLGLRESLLSWAEERKKPTDLYVWRNLALFLLRRDLDIKGLESYNPKDRASLLEKLRAEVAALQKSFDEER